MDYFQSPPQGSPPMNTHEPPVIRPESSISWGRLFLAALILAAAVAYGLYKRRGSPEMASAASKSEEQKTELPWKKMKKDAPPPLFPGDTRDRVIEVLGDPQGVSHRGTRELLLYTNGQVVLENGLVIHVEIGSERPIGQVEIGGTQVILRGSGKLLQQKMDVP